MSPFAPYRLRWLRAWRLPLAVAGAMVGCSGEHDFLAQRSVDAAATTDVRDASATIDVRGDERRIAVPVDAADVSDLPPDDRADLSLPPEPPGRWTFTWTNGLVDADSARFCFVPVVGDQEMRDRADPLPAMGLPFGKSLVLGELRGVDLSTMDVHPYAILGAYSGEGGLGCAALLDAQDAAAGDDAGARAPVAVPLPLIPAGTLVEARSYLGVATGCAMRWPFPDVDGDADAHVDANDADADAYADANDVDADAHADAKADVDATADVLRPPDRAAVCGTTSRAPNAGLVLVRLSRRDVGTRFGLQGAHASTAVAGARIAVERVGGNAPIFSVDLGPGQIVPRDTLIDVAREDFGASLGAAMLRVSSPVGAFPSTVFSLGSALAASGIDESALAAGDLLTLVLIGAQPGQDPIPPWNAARIAVVRNAPLEGGD